MRAKLEELNRQTTLPLLRAGFSATGIIFCYVFVKFYWFHWEKCTLQGPIRLKNVEISKFNKFKSLVIKRFYANWYGWHITNLLILSQVAWQRLCYTTQQNNVEYKLYLNFTLPKSTQNTQHTFYLLKHVIFLLSSYCLTFKTTVWIHSEIRF